MKILAFNGSPRKKNGMTDRILDIFLESAEDAGAEVTKHYVPELDIKGCLGCFNCWWGTPGKCVHSDDMEWVIPAILDTDILVFATPVYHDNIIHYLQRLRERTLPLAMPEFIVREGETRHPGRYNRERKTVIVATAGFPDSSAFDVTKRLFQNAVHIHLPSSVIIEQGKELPIIKGFVKDIQETARILVERKDIDESLSLRLKMEFPPEIKEMLVARHNEDSERMTPSG